MPWGSRRPLRTQNVFLVMTDGFRRQEMFDGVQESLINKELGGIRSTDTVRKIFGRPSAKERRETLMPFMWNIVAKQGQIYGNAEQGSPATVTNGFNFSYPGYNETLTGYGDPRVDSNDPRPNPNETVFEWLNKMPAFNGRVAAFGAWERFHQIFNAERCGFPVSSAYESVTAGKMTDGLEVLNRLKLEMPKPWDFEPYDSLTYYSGREYFKANKPRLLYISFGETDEYGHEGNYWAYLDAARRYDTNLKDLWELAQSMPEYRDKTTMIMLTDHGRGDDPHQWRDHGKGYKGAEKIWIAVIGPDTPAQGERVNCEAVTQSQVAATIAALLGQDYNAHNPQAGKPLKDVIAK